jgi:hypothetical protein
VGFLTPINQGIADSNDHSRSDNLSALTAEWWQWALSIPTPVNPLLDTTGSNCMVGQHGPVWFLAGVFIGGNGNRTCSIPDDKSLFFPVANNVNINTPNVCGQDSNNIPIRMLRQAPTAAIDGITEASAELDGKPLKNVRRVRSEVFAVSLPEDNIFDAPCSGATPPGVPAGTYSPSVDEGLYVLLPPLDPGPLILHFRAVNPSPTTGFTQDVIYNLDIQHVTVKP